MKHLSRFDIEAIADKYVQAYMALPDVRNTQIYRIDPELLLEKVLGLNVDIVSDASVLEGENKDAFKGEANENLYIEVSQAEGEKCERCWMYSKTVGEDSEHKTLCARCASVVKTL